MSVSNMKKLTVLAFHKDADRVLQALTDLRCVELRTVESCDALQELEPTPDDGRTEALEKELASVREAIDFLSEYAPRRKGFGKELAEYSPALYRRDGSEEKAREAVKRSLELAERMDEINTAQERLQEQELCFLPWLDFDALLDRTETEDAFISLGTCPKKTDTDALAVWFEHRGGKAEFLSEDRKRVYLAVTVPKAIEEAANDHLASVGFTKETLPLLPLTSQQAYDRAEVEYKALDAELLRLEEEACSLADSLGTVGILYDQIETLRTVSALRAKTVRTKTCTVLECWIPANRLGEVEDCIKALGCAYEAEDPAPEEDPPVLLRQGGFASLWNWIPDMYAYPKSRRFDPSVIMGIFYFLFFGLTVADVGYGLLLTLGCLIGIRMTERGSRMQRTFGMLVCCGASSMLMGVLFGGWFENLPTSLLQNVFGVSVDTSLGRFFGEGLWFDPLQYPMRLFILSLVLGGIHLLVGTAIRFAYLLRERKKAEAIAYALPYWVILIGAILLLIHPTSAIATLAGGVLLLFILRICVSRGSFGKRVLHGLCGTDGLLRFLSDLATYLCLPLSAFLFAWLGGAVNRVTLLADGAGGAAVMILALILGHLLTLAVCMPTAYLLLSRLRYLGFAELSRFSGGKPFAPAEPSNQYSEPIEF